MNTTKEIKTLLSIIDESFAIGVNDEFPSTEFATSEVNGEPDNEILYITWKSFEDGEIKPHELGTKFTEEGFKNAVVDENMITLEDFEGDEFNLFIFDLIDKKIDIKS